MAELNVDVVVVVADKDDMDDGEEDKHKNDEVAEGTTRNRNDDN